MIYADHALNMTQIDDRRDKDRRNVIVNVNLERCIKAIWLELLPDTLEAIKQMPKEKR